MSTYISLGVAALLSIAACQFLSVVTKFNLFFDRLMIGTRLTQEMKRHAVIVAFKVEHRDLEISLFL